MEMTSPSLTPDGAQMNAAASAEMGWEKARVTYTGALCRESVQPRAIYGSVNANARRDLDLGEYWIETRRTSIDVVVEVDDTADITRRGGPTVGIRVRIRVSIRVGAGVRISMCIVIPFPIGSGIRPCPIGGLPVRALGRGLLVL